MVRCEECGFDPAGVTGDNAADSVRAFGRRYQAPLTRFLPNEDGLALLRVRVDDATWSALEYAAHVRDVFALFARRVRQLQERDGADLEVVDHDAVVAAGTYADLEAGALAGEIDGAANALGDAFAALTTEEWERAGVRAGEPRSMLDLARRAVHEGSHHLLDIGRVMRAARQR